MRLACCRTHGTIFLEDEECDHCVEIIAGRIRKIRDGTAVLLTAEQVRERLLAQRKVRRRGIR